LAEGLLPISQTGMLAGAGLAYHDYEGIALDLDERGRLQADLGENGVMILRNHGTLSVGSTVAEAFLRIYIVEQACTAQVRALSMGRALHDASDASIEKSRGVGRMNSAPVAQLAWPALLRKLDRELPGYAD
jgi:ribulose-5-phosphate 4-epimerase/fuculose-1-phosphate aldolase